MKKNAIRYINDNEALVTKAFAKKAIIFGTEEYQLWKAYRVDFPAAKMVTKSIKKNPTKKTYKNLTYTNMELFFKQQPNSKELLAEFEKQKELSKIQENPYRAVLAWFLKRFPNYDDYKDFFADTEAMMEQETELSIAG